MLSAQVQFIKYKNYLIPVGAGVEVTTVGFSNVENTSATLELILDSGQDDTLVWFEFGVSNQIMCDDPERSPFASRMDVSEGESFSDTVTGLLADTTYFFRACAASSSGLIASGEIRPFQTTNTIKVMTSSPDNPTLNSATLRASLIAGRNIRVWFALSGPNGAQPGCPAAPSASFVGFVENSGSVEVGRPVTGLVPGARYRYRACAQNNVGGGGIVSGASVSFITNDAPTEAETLPLPSLIESDSVTLEGKIVSGTNVAAFFVLDDDSDISCTAFSARNILRNRGHNTGDIVSIKLTRTNQGSPLSNLVSNTKYYYRFCAEGSIDNDEGIVHSFVTQGDGDAMTLDRTAIRTDESLTVTGRLTRAGQPKNTWFVVLEGNVSITDNTCSLARESDRRGVSVLTTTAETNVYTAENLDDFTTYTIGFCGEGASAGTGDVSLGGRRVFTTKRNLNTVVTRQCGTGEVFRSEDGPLRSIWITQNYSVSANEASPVRISNFRADGVVNWQVLESQFAAQTVGVNTVPRRTKQVLPVHPVRRGNTLRYGVSIFSSPSDNWTATFSCRTADCVAGGLFVECGAGNFPL